jgi:hypothetical protein
MRFFTLFLLFIRVCLASDQEYLCNEFYPVKNDNIKDIQKVIIENSNTFKTSYYMYFEGDTLEDLQSLKNCIDYTMCGKYQESIVDDPKNYRLHLWKSMTPKQLSSLVKSCPVTDLAKKLVVRENNQDGKIVDIKKIKPRHKSEKKVSNLASPAIFHDPGEAVSNATVDIVKKLLESNKIQDAHNIILQTWKIDLHGHELIYTKKPGTFAVTNHSKKSITYGKEWLKEPCDYIRMIRHEAEHVAQVKMSKTCPDHNFSEHKNRERAAHLNDARFMKNICANNKSGDSVRNYCLDRFRKNYINH